MIKKSAAHEIPNFRVSPLGAVVTHKVRIINDYSFSFEAQNGKTKGGLNAHTDSDSVAQCLCAEALPKFLAELVNLRKKYPTKRILMSKADVSDAFRNVRIGPDLVVIDFRLTFGWSGSPGFWGVMSAAAEHAHCNTTYFSISPDAEQGSGLDGSHGGGRSLGRRKSNDGTHRRKNQSAPGGGWKANPFFATASVDDDLLIRVQQSDDDTTAITASASLASHHERLFGPGETGVTPILAPKKYRLGLYD